MNNDINATIASVIAGLTLVQAREYASQTDKLMWIEVNLLDPHDIPRHFAMRVEEALCALLNAAAGAPPLVHPAAQAEGLALADEQLSKVGLPTYAELRVGLAAMLAKHGCGREGLNDLWPVEAAVARDLLARSNIY